ncbi:uncharacterized protein LOC106884525 [Octopus bimaculoides]|uniref:Uncharacterized protein n=1 Tax=Octopus bimaculoides TaxID=37653 RepID=A0A0L8I2P6_OCTBM|nr:uncharacterized protein LOC106884525 [Octopus bimaculoides]|eukprot:XP_014767443.1 PREDICTED: uncharacterized protein LOC106884525 [Octopus bimaculoides]
MWQMLLDWLWIVWNFMLLYYIGVRSLFQDVTNERKKPSALPPQHGRVAIVTGGTTGIGYYTTKTLCSLGMHVIIASRCKKHIQKAIDDIKKEQPDAVIEGFEVDLGSMKSVHKFAYEFKSRRLPLHMLINNAGVMYVPYKKTEDGLEKHIAVNYMGHFLLSILLLPVLNMSGTNQLFARIVNVSSSTHRVGNIDLSTFTSKGAKPSRYSPYASYSQSKLAMIMATYELARRLKAAKCFRVTVNTLHPGVVDTNLHSNAVFPVPLIRCLISRFYLTPEQGADTVLHVALSPDLEKQSGGYYENCEKATSSKLSNSMQLQQAIWHTTCSVLGIDPHDLPTSRSHDMSGNNAGMPFSWHDDYMNSPYQFNSSPSLSNEMGISCITGPQNTITTFGMISKSNPVPDHFAVDFDRDGSPTPLHVPKPEITLNETVIQITEDPKILQMEISSKATQKPKPTITGPMSASDIALPDLKLPSSCDEVVDMDSINKISNEDSIPDIYVSHYDVKNNLENIPEEENENDCKNFMSTPTIGPQCPVPDGPKDDISEHTPQLRAVMCGNDIIYVANSIEDVEAGLAKSSSQSTPTFVKTSSNASGSFISIVEGPNKKELMPNYSNDRRSSVSGNSSCVSIPHITLNESMLASLNYESDSLSELENSDSQQYLNTNSDFITIDETAQNFLTKKSKSAGNSPHFELNETKTIVKDFANSAPNLSSQFTKDETFKLNELESEVEDDRENHTKSEHLQTSVLPNMLEKNNMREKILSDDDNEYDPSSSAEESTDSEDFENIKFPLKYSARSKYNQSPSISDDDDTFISVPRERGRSMVRRCSQVSPSVLDDVDADISLSSVTLKDITIKLPEKQSGVSPELSPHSLCKYQDDQILKFVNDIITESIKLSAEDSELQNILEGIAKENPHDVEKIFTESTQMSSKDCELPSTLVENLEEECSPSNVKDSTETSSKESDVSDSSNEYFKEYNVTIVSESEQMSSIDSEVSEKPTKNLQECSIDVDEETKVFKVETLTHNSESEFESVTMQHDNIAPAVKDEDNERENVFVGSISSEIRTFLAEKGSETTKNIPDNQRDSRMNPAFSQKGWDRLPYNATEAEMNAFREYAAFTDSLKRTGRITPIPHQLDTVMEEVVTEDTNSMFKTNQEELHNIDCPRKPRRNSQEIESNIIKDCALFADAFLTDHSYLLNQPTEEDLNKPKESPVRKITKQFEEKINLSGRQSPLCPQNSPESSSRASSPHPQYFFPSNSMTESSFEEEEEEIRANRVIFSPLSSPVKRIDEDVDSMGFLFLIPQNKYPKAKIVSVSDNIDSNLETVKGVPIDNNVCCVSSKYPSSPHEDCRNEAAKKNVTTTDMESIHDTQSEISTNENDGKDISAREESTFTESDLNQELPSNIQDESITKSETSKDTIQMHQPLVTNEVVQNITESDQSPLTETESCEPLSADSNNISESNQIATEDNLTKQSNCSEEHNSSGKDCCDDNLSQTDQHITLGENFDNDSNQQSDRSSDTVVDMPLGNESCSENQPMTCETPEQVESEISASICQDEQTSPTNNAETGGNIEFTDNSEISSASYYSPTKSSSDSEDCWFDSKSLSLDFELNKDDTGYAKMLASYYAVSKEECQDGSQDDTAGNTIATDGNTGLEECNEGSTDTPQSTIADVAEKDT